ncbi:SUN domain-containing ossification factor-like isoform X2 [Channa argus]|uniref:SUN domain-containing ossification factor-like isoform X2 n=1 Tax=Channa argus TaxID=215402 RepID=UPI002944035B|nr:hypothetical protein Q8A73_015092 [Channa argus]
MKMTPLLWRVVSVCLCVAVVCWHPLCYIACTESHQESQEPLSSQDISLEEELEELNNHHKDQESSVLPAQSLSESELFIDDEQQKEEQTTQESDKKEQYSEEEATVELELEVDKDIIQPETISENLYHETSVTEDQVSSPLLPSPDPVSVFADEFKDNPSIFNLQDSVPNSVSDDASDETAPELLHPDIPTSDCEGEQNDLYDSDSSSPMVLENTSNAHAAGTKIHTDPSVSSPSIHSTQQLEANTSNMLKEQDLSSPVTADTDSSVSSKDPEDIPTFDEWKRKEVEKEKTLSTHTSNNEGSHTAKKVQKNFNNYASVECGAKILGCNPEAKSTSAILKENMDLYMLNPCSNKIWFIIELCEPIQLKQLDIANFELFSSTPKDFLVSISDRYPTNKWLKLGTFHARDERTVQSFPLDEHLYAKYVKMFTKYIKVELVSYFGSEHFCPLSLIRVFGTSMVEEYEEIADPPERPDDQDDDLDYPPGSASGEVKLSKNLIGSAKDVILNMVNNIAVNVLGGVSEVQGNVSFQELNITEPSAQLESATTTDTTSTPDTEQVEISPESEMPANESPFLETPVLEMEDTDATKQELPPLEQIIVTPLEKEEDEPVSSTITLLDREDELYDHEELTDCHKQQLGNPNYCSPPSSASSCCCAASLQEYLHQQSSALLSKKRKCQKSDRKPMIPPIQTPTLHQPLFPSAFPEPQLEPSEVHQPHEKEQAFEEEPEKGANPSETSPPSGSTTGSHKESMSESPVLEPSQTSNLPKPSATNSSPAKPTPIVETPQLSPEEPAKEPSPEKSHNVQTVEKHTTPSTSLNSSIYVKPIVSATVDETLVASTEESVDSLIEINTPDQILDKTDQSQILLPTTTPHLEHHSDLPAVPESTAASTTLPQPSQDTVTELEPSASPSVITEIKMEDISTSSGLPRPSSPAPPASPSLSDIYAETTNATEQNGIPVHGSSQKESVFMRLNNRIKALEMNMSLSGRYLEQLSQRYRKQMEEMQKAFNKTIIKLQNTSKVAEEQDQRQTESIQLLQGQLENMTQLVLNLSVRVSQLQNEVSDRQNYLLLSLALCLCLGLLMCVSHCQITTVPPATNPDLPIQTNYTYCSPERQSASCDKTGLKRSASYPLIHSESLQLAATEGSEMLHAVEAQTLGPVNRKKRRRKMKSIEKVETLKPSFHAPELCNGAVVCNSVPVTTNPTPLTKRLLQPTFRDSPSEGSSEASSHSDDPSFCGITTACSRICEGLPPPKTQPEKRASRRRCPKPGCPAADLFQAPRKNDGKLLTISSIQDIMNRKTEHSSGAFRVNVTLSGPA